MTLTPPIILLLIAFAAAWWLIVVTSIRFNCRSIFRHRLWVLRDLLADDIIADRLPANPAVVRLLHATEGAIYHAAEFSLVQFLLVPTMVNEQEELAVDESAKEMTGEQRDHLAKYHRLLSRILLRHFLMGNVMGWIVVATMFTIFALKGLARVGVHPFKEARRAMVWITC